MLTNSCLESQDRGLNSIPPRPMGAEKKRDYEYYLNKGMIRVDEENGCWIWMGGQYDDGYGRVRGPGGRKGTPMRAQRYFYELTYGKVPGLDVGHKCHRRLCVCIDHLEAVTHGDNLAVMFADYQFGPSDRSTCLDMLQQGTDLSLIAEVLMAPRPAIFKLVQELSPEWRQPKLV